MTTPDTPIARPADTGLLALLLFSTLCAYFEARRTQQRARDPHTAAVNEGKERQAASTAHGLLRIAVGNHGNAALMDPDFPAIDLATLGGQNVRSLRALLDRLAAGGIDAEAEA